jgi:hypothetical protein
MDSGYTNEETRMVALVLTNVEADYLYWTEAVADDGVGVASVELEDYYEELQRTAIAEPQNTTEEQRQFLFDIGSLWRVNWREVAEEFVALDSLRALETPTLNDGALPGDRTTI